MKLTESIVEQAALDWLGGLGYEVLSGLEIAPGESAAERAADEQKRGGTRSGGTRPFGGWLASS